MNDQENISECDFLEKETGICCRRVERGLVVEFGKRIGALERKLTKQEKEYHNYARNLKECVILRDGQINAARKEIQAKGKIMETMNEKIERSDERIVKLSEKVEDLITRLGKKEDSGETVL